MRNSKDVSLNREIGQLGFAAIALNGVIGAGIFALPAVAAARGGYFSPWLFLICAVLIMTVVLSFAGRQVSSGLPVGRSSTPAWRPDLLPVSKPVG
jgi:Kef-type K+ transport system membrane component KefB